MQPEESQGVRTAGSRFCILCEVSFLPVMSTVSSWPWGALWAYCVLFTIVEWLRFCSCGDVANRTHPPILVFGGFTHCWHGSLNGNLCGEDHSQSSVNQRSTYMQYLKQPEEGIGSPEN